MKKTFVVLNFNKADEVGDVFAPGSVKLPEKNIYVLKNFDTSYPPLGTVEKLEEKDNKLWATVEVSEDITGLYPAIGFQTGIKKSNKSAGVYKKITLFAIGVSCTKNMDETIPPIG